MPDRPRAAKSATWGGPAIDEWGDAPAAFVQLSAQALAPLSRQQWAAPAVRDGTWDDETALGGGLGPGAQEALLAQLADELALAATLLGIGEGD
jgi:hypothetical protein